MPSFQVENPNYAQTVHEGFARQGLMQHLGARLTAVSPGEVVIELPTSPNLTQQHGFVHAGAVTAVVDSACGYAAISLLPPQYDALTEFKVNLLAPATGDQAHRHWARSQARAHHHRLPRRGISRQQGQRANPVRHYAGNND